MRRPNLTLAASAVVYMTARVFDLNLASYPAGTTWCGVVETAELGGAGASVPPAKADRRRPERGQEPGGRHQQRIRGRALQSLGCDCILDRIEDVT